MILYLHFMCTKVTCIIYFEIPFDAYVCVSSKLMSRDERKLASEFENLIAKKVGHLRSLICFPHIEGFYNYK